LGHGVSQVLEEMRSLTQGGGFWEHGNQGLFFGL